MSKPTAIHELPRTADDGNGIAWQFEPSRSADQERIGLHTNRLRRILRMGGLGEVVIRGYYGDQTTYNTTVDSISTINEDGSTTGIGKATVARAETQRSSLEEIHTLPTSYRWPTATIELNRNELADRISNAVHRGGDANKAWAQEMDYALRRGLLSVLRRKNVKDLTASLQDGLLSATGAVMAIPPYHWMWQGTVLAVAHGLTFFNDSMQLSIDTGSAQFDKKRLSIFAGGIQYDRWALASGMLAAQRLITYSKQSLARPEATDM